MKGSKFGKRAISLLLATMIMLGVFCLAPLSAGAADSDSRENASISNVNDDMQISGVNSFGNMVANAIDDTTEQQEENGGYNVFSACRTPLLLWRYMRRTAKKCSQAAAPTFRPEIKRQA